jgi:hypothetical protein
MGLFLYRVLPYGFLLGFGGGGLLWIMGRPDLGKPLVLFGAFVGLSVGFLGVMMSRYKMLFSIMWFIILLGMIARVTLWKDIQPNSPETSALIRLIDLNWGKLLMVLVGYILVYGITWGQSVEVMQWRRRPDTSRPIYPTFPYDQGAPSKQEPATGETIAQPVVASPPARESMMQRRERHLRIRRLLAQEREAEAIALMRPGEYFIDGEIETEYD